MIHDKRRTMPLSKRIRILAAEGVPPADALAIVRALVAEDPGLIGRVEESDIEDIETLARQATRH